MRHPSSCHSCHLNIGVVGVVGVERVSRGDGACVFKAKLQHAACKRCGSKVASRSGIFEHELDAAKLVGSAQGIADRINQVQRGSSRNVYA